jgi:hypothetical protein
MLLKQALLQLISCQRKYSRIRRLSRGRRKRGRRWWVVVAEMTGALVVASAAIAVKAVAMTRSGHPSAK